MITYFIHDGRNESGPFSIDILKKQKLTRNTPVREHNSDNWVPAEKIPGLKEMVAPRKIKRPKDIVPVMIARVTALKQQRPKTLYACLLCIALLAGISIYSLRKKNSFAPPGNAKAAQNRDGIIVEELPAAGISGTALSKTDELKDDKEKDARLHWNKLISATNSNYGIGFLGGIKDLKVIVNNRSDYPIDEAVVDVTYIKANGGVWKAKPITIYGVGAHDSKEQSVPDVGRGKKVTVSIKKIVSKKMKFSYSAGKKVTNHEDPYVTE